MDDSGATASHALPRRRKNPALIAKDHNCIYGYIPSRPCHPVPCHPSVPPSSESVQQLILLNHPSTSLIPPPPRFPFVPRNARRCLLAQHRWRLEAAIRKASSTPCDVNVGVDLKRTASHWEGKENCWPHRAVQDFRNFLHMTSRARPKQAAGHGKYLPVLCIGQLAVGRQGC